MTLKDDKFLHKLFIENPVYKLPLDRLVCVKKLCKKTFAERLLKYFTTINKYFGIVSTLALKMKFNISVYVVMMGMSNARASTYYLR